MASVADEATRKWCAKAGEGWAKAEKISAGWKQLSSFACGYVPIEMWLSPQGVHVLIAQVEGPLVNSYVVVPTECLSDNGLPHTLEHLVFLGSEDYPYKGVLDKVSFRNLATGTNAYTDVHHTAYTLTTAGSEGMLAMLPVFLDHIFYPVITPSGFVTEIYHVNGEGADAGVVFSEMQAIENEARTVAYLALRKLLYPGKCGFAMETGGIMEEIRTLTVEQIREYHAEYYRPDNVFVIVTGMVEAGKVLSAVDKMQHKFSQPSRHPAAGVKGRPFAVHAVPCLTQSVVRTLEFPADDEDASGCVMVAWRGEHFTDFARSLELTILHAYLSESEVSLLHHHFVEGGDEGEEGVCASVSCGLCENAETFHYISFDAVRVSSVDGIQARLVELLEELCVTGFDMTRMATVINRFHVRHLNSLEDAPHDTLAHYMTLALLFGHDSSHVNRKLESVFSEVALERLEAWTSEQWVALLRDSMLSRATVCVKAVPSAARAAQLSKEEEERVGKRVRELGDEGLAQLQAALEDATASNNMPIPDAILEAFSVPSVDSISFIPLSTATYPSSARAARDAQTAHALQQFATQHADPSASSRHIPSSLKGELDALCREAGKERDRGVGGGCGGGGGVTEKEIERMALYVQLDDVASDFIEVRVVLNTAALSDAQRAYLEVYLEAFYSLPLRRRVTLGGAGESVTEGGGAGSEDTEEVAWETVVQELQVAANNLLNDIPEMKREGEHIALCGLREKLYGAGSNHRACNLVRQQRFLTALVARLESEPQAVIAEIEGMRAAITGEGTIMVQVVGNMKKLAQEGLHSLLPFVTNFRPPASLATLGAPRAVMQPGDVRLARELLAPATAGTASVVSLAALESCYLSVASKGLPSFQHADTAPMLVATELLTCIEGPLWNLIRGQGLAYSFTMYGDADEGLCYFSLSRSPALAKAYTEAGRLVSAFSCGGEELTGMALENAKASVMSSIVSRESTVGQCGMQSLMTALRRSGPGHNARLLKSIAAVTREQVLHVISTYLMGLFAPSSANVFITCSPSKLDEVCSGMEELKWSVEKPANFEAVVTD